jgi:hypothetical protein
MSQMNMQNMLGMTPEQMEIARKTRYAEALRRQSEEPMQGQMVSGHYIAPSWTQGLAKMLSAYGSGKMERDAAEAAKAYGEQQRTDFTDTASKYAQALRGTPEQQTAYEADNPFGEDLGNLQTVTPGTPGDPNKALEIALQSRNPMWQQFAMQAQLKQASQSPRDRFGAVMPQNYTPESLAAFQRTGNYGDLVPVMKGAAFGNVNPGQFTPESLARYQQTGNYADLVPFRAPVQIDQGDRKTLFDPGTQGTRTFDVAPPPEAMPAFKAAQTTATETAKAGVEARAASEKSARSAASDLPVIEDKANYALNLLDTMVGSEDGKIKPHKGFDNYVGTWTGEYQAKIPSSQAADFKTYHDQVKGTAFLEAFESLKGGGQITQIEGDKATAAITRMERAQSREEYTKAARELQGIIRQGLKRARDKAKQPSGNRPKLDDLWD